MWKIINDPKFLFGFAVGMLLKVFVIVFFMITKNPFSKEELEISVIMWAMFAGFYFSRAKRMS